MLHFLLTAVFLFQNVGSLTRQGKEVWIMEKHVYRTASSAICWYVTLLDHEKRGLFSALVKWGIGLDKRGYQVNIFLVSPQKHMLWVLIRSASSSRI